MADESPSCYQYLPWLMITTNDVCYDGFHNISDENIYHKNLDKLFNKQCIGSSHGWLIMVDDETPSIYVVNPLKLSARFELPSLLAFPDILEFDDDGYFCYDPSLGIAKMSSTSIKKTYVKKVILSKFPTQKGCMAVAIFGEHKRLAFCRVGEQKWTFIVGKQAYLNGYEDVVFDSKGERFFAINYDGVITSCDSAMSLLESVYERSPPLPLLETIYEPSPPLMKNHADKRYLVFDTKGQLMLVNRYIGCEDYDNEGETEGDSDCNGEGESKGDNDCFIDCCSDFDDFRDCYDDHKTSRFGVFRLKTEKGEVEEVDGLEGGALFLGKNQSLFLSPPGFSGVGTDSIYFTDDNFTAHHELSSGARDTGVFDMKDGSITDIKCCPNGGQGIWPPPIWVSPFSH